MKMRRFLLLSGVSMAVVCFVGSSRSQTVVTFDDLHETGSGSFILGTYQGLVWSNFGCVNGILNARDDYPHLTNGSYYGVASVSNVALNAGGWPAEVDSATRFDFLSAYFTGVWHSNLNIEVRGFNGTNLLYLQTVVANATNPTLFTFNFMDIDRLYFDSFGGQTAFGFAGGNQFAMDNMTIEFIPEPSSLLLTGIGVVMLWTIGRRRRVP